MATVTNWIDHLNKPAEEVVGAVYPGAGSMETTLVIIGVILWLGWHVLTAKSESDELDRLSRKRHGNCCHFRAPGAGACFARCRPRLGESFRAGDGW